MQTGSGDLQPDAQGESPAKKNRTDANGNNGGETELTLDSIREAFRTELDRQRGEEREHFAGVIESVQTDVRKVCTRGKGVESGVTLQMNRTLEMLSQITKYDVQQKAISDVQQGQQKFEERLAAMEKQLASGSTTGSTADTSYEGGRKPALIMGGWDSDLIAQLRTHSKLQETS
eukprot:s228_g10.t1